MTHNRRTLVTLVITGAKASLYFYFYIRSWRDIAALVGEENIPKILMGYEKNGHHVKGNFILNATDAVTGVGTPFEDHEAKVNRRYWFDYDWRRYYSFDLELDHFGEVPIPDTALTKREEEPTSIIFSFAVGFSKRGLEKLRKGEF